MVTNVYIDGFNLYYRALKGKQGRRWLDLRALCELCLPNDSVGRIRYFTARVSSRRPGDHDPQRQDVYLRALSSVTHLEIHYGHYMSSIRSMKCAEPPPEYVKVLRSEEKGSDVNLASFLLLDAFKGEADTFVVISNDTDLVEPLRMVRWELGKHTGALYPSQKASGSLRQAEPSFARRINPGQLSRSQLPNSVQLNDGTVVTKPPGW